MNTLKHHRFIVDHSINGTFQTFIYAFQRYFNTFHRINISLTLYLIPR